MKKLLIFLFSTVIGAFCFASCGTNNHDHISEWKYDALTHWEVVTCTLNICDFNMPAPAEHIDENTDGKCDVCGATLQTYANLFEIENWITDICSNEVKQIKIGDINISPYGFNNYYYLTTKSAIESLFLQILDLHKQALPYMY